MTFHQHEQNIPSAADGTLLHVTKYSSSSPSSITPPKANLLVVHGYLEYGHRYQELAECLVQNYDIHVTVFDLRGHGQSGGRVRGGVSCWQYYLDDIDTVLKTVPKNAPTFVLGHSMGGLLVMEWMLAKHPQVDGILMTCPFLRPAKDFTLLETVAAKTIGPLLGFVPVPAKIPGADLTNDVSRQQQSDADPQRLHYATIGWAHQAMQAQDRVARYLQDKERMTNLPPLWLAYAEQDRVADPCACAAAFATLEQSVAHNHVAVSSSPDDMHVLFNDLHRSQWFVEAGSWMERVVVVEKSHTDIPPSNCQTQGTPSLYFSASAAPVNAE